MKQKDNNGHNPVDLAEMRGHRKCSHFLKIAVAKVQRQVEPEIDRSLLSNIHYITKKVGK